MRRLLFRHTPLTAAIGLLVLLCCAETAQAQTQFYTTHWYSIDANWTIEAGQPAAAGIGFLYDNGARTRLAFNGAPSADYSIQTLLSCTLDGNDPYSSFTLSHYLRDNGSGSYYRVDFVGNTGSSGTNTSGTVTLYSQFPNHSNALASASASCNQTMTTTIVGAQITVSMNGTELFSVTDASLATGNPGVGTQGAFADTQDGDWDLVDIGATTLSTPSATTNAPPTNVTGAAPSWTQVNLSWTAPTSYTAGSYKIYRSGVEVGDSTSTSYTDNTGDPGVTYSYTVSAVNSSSQESSQSTALVITTPQNSFSAPDAGGGVEYASSWGGGGPEKIALLTGSLGIRIPLITLKQQSRGPGFQLMASYNSQFWSHDSAGDHNIAINTGYGLGWTFQIGAIYAVFNGNLIDHVEYQDTGGVIHKLWAPANAPNTNTVYLSQDSTYLIWNYANNTLTFRDGSVWTFGCESSSVEPDAGTLYPTELEDPDGNLITVTYQPGLLQSGVNGSSRITTIQDSVTTYTWSYFNQPLGDETTNPAAGYQLCVTGVSHGGSFSDASFGYSFPTAANGIASPFASSPTGAATMLLTSITFTGSPAPFNFTYYTNANGTTSGEITEIQFPYKGYFRYTYSPFTFTTSTGSLTKREITARYMSADGTSGSEQTYTISHPSSDSSLAAHTQATVTDPVGNQKLWNFFYGTSEGWDAGLSNQMLTYQGTSTVLRTVNNTWTQDNTGSQTITNPRVYATNTILQDSQTQSRTERDTDTHGNTTAVREYGYGYGSPGALYRTTTTTYLSSSAYTALNILNRPTSVTVCAGAAGCSTPASATTTTYDNQTIQNASLPQHDPVRIASYTTRGTPTQVSNNGLVTTMTYDIGGNLLSTSGGLQAAASVSYLNTGQLSSASAGATSVSATYNPDTTTSSVTGSSANTFSFGYTSSGYRPQTTTAPDGSVTNYTYSDMYSSGPYNGGLGQSWSYPYNSTVTTPAGKVTKNILDGFGRTIFAMTQLTSSPAVWITTATQYSACSCSATGKAVSTSRPYQSDSNGNAINGDTPLFTTTTSDGLGRPVTVALPAPSTNTTVVGANTNQNTYSYDTENDTVNGTAWIGSRTTVTDPMGHQKRYLYDAFGQLLRVDEPNSSSTLVETAAYTYDVLGHMTQVQMPKADGSYTQTRTFVYNNLGQLTSSTTPEKGTVSYTYWPTPCNYPQCGLLYTKTEPTGAPGANQTKTIYYLYDNKRRLTNIQSPPNTNLATFTYDWEWNSNITASNTVGRMVTASSGGYTYHYSYNVMGRPIQQILETPVPADYGSTMALIATYTYDADGKLTAMKYPGAMYMTADEEDLPYWGAGTAYQFGYDGLGRQGTVTSGGTALATGVFNDAGQLASWTEGSSSTLTRTYDPARGWLTNLTAASNLNMTYSYNADGQTTSVADAINSGQSASYTYDSLNRLASAATPNWSMSWAYDEFGNRTSETGTGTASSLTSSLTYSASTNQITTSGYGYDAAGNMTAMPNGTSMTYDALDRVQTVTTGSGTATMKYDAFNRRIEHDLPNGTQRIYFYDMGGHMIAEYDVPSVYYTNPTAVTLNGPTRTKTYLAGRVVGQWSDKLGSTRYTPSGSTYAHYYPYGEEITSTANDTYKYARTYRDSDSGLDYAKNRFYASAIGRFLTPDKKRKSAHSNSPQSWNRYAYARNNPINRIDPRGKDSCDPDGDSNCGDDGCTVDTARKNKNKDRESPVEAEGRDRHGPAVVEAAAGGGGDDCDDGGDGGGGGDGEDNDGEEDSEPTAAAAPIKVTNFTTTGFQAQDVQNDLLWLQQALQQSSNSDCNSWLAGNNGVINTLEGSISATGTQDQVFAGVANFNTNSVAAVAGEGGTDMPDGQALLTVNINGAFFNSAYSVSTASGTTYTGGSAQAQGMILLHELAHLTGAQGFTSNDNNTTASNANNQLVSQHCQGILNTLGQP
jgi:RHS repeat-associated protein